MIPAQLEQGAAGAPFVPGGDFQGLAAKADYVEEEWIASGTDDRGLPYRTQVFVRRPRDPGRFSGKVFVESLHASGIAPIYMYCAPHILRSGHGWACIVSQKTALDEHVKGSDPERYADLGIGTDAAGSVPEIPASGEVPQDLASFLVRLAVINQASNAILAQVGAALRCASGPFGAVSHIFLTGHSQTGFVATNFIIDAHASHRLADGGPIYDGYFPSGYPREAFGPRDVPLIQVMSDGDVFDEHARLLRADNPGRHYRRPDSDAPDDRYRLYELAGVPHLGTRHPPFNDTRVSGPRQNGLIKSDDVMNSLPHNELFSMALEHLVNWAADGVVPPRAERIETTADGRTFARDEHGNSRGGVRCVQLDVPRATYHPVPLDSEGNPAFATVGTEVAFDAAKMERLYGTPAVYRDRFNRRLDELVAAGWFLAEDAEGMRSEAAAQQW